MIVQPARRPEAILRCRGKRPVTPSHGLVLPSKNVELKYKSTYICGPRRSVSAVMPEVLQVCVGCIYAEVVTEYCSDPDALLTVVFGSGENENVEEVEFVVPRD